MDTYRICVILFSLKQGWVLGIQFRTGYQNQAKSSLEQGQVSGGPAAHPHQISAQSLEESRPGRIITHLRTWQLPCCYRVGWALPRMI